MRYPLLNYIDLKVMAQSLNAQIVGARVDRIFVPALPEHPNQYFKQEWCFDLFDQKRSTQLFFSLRSQACGVFPLAPKTLKPAGQASRSGFDLSLVKHLEGSRILKVEAVSNERILEITFSANEEKQKLFISLIPAQPKAILVLPTDDQSKVPVGRILPAELQNKFSATQAFGENLKNYPSLFLDVRTQQALEIRRARIQKALSERIDYWKRKIESFTEHLSHQGEQQVWNKYGTLLQAQLYTKPVLQNGFYTLTDFETGEPIQIPGDPKLNLKQQLEHFFKQAKRIKTRTEESTARKKAAEDKIATYASLLKQLELNKTPLSEIESALGIGKEKSGPTTTTSKTIGQYSGKIFTSAEGLSILVGRSAIENIELTFKIARGNDIWLHVKGRPGAHVVIILPPKKNASLETLLDAAHLCIHYSGGKEWGKTEVDYTPRKFVKKIKNQTEVSYSGNKTLMISPDPARMKRLLGEAT